jgi:hypothetical protein
MSKVISFRLNKDNQREASAILVLQEWIAQGYSIRQIITEALLKLDEVHREPSTTQLLELNEMLNQINQVLEQLGHGKPTHLRISGRLSGDAGLDDSFIASIKQTVKQGVKVG